MGFEYDNHPDLSQGPGARATDPETSHLAAAELRGSKRLGELQRIALDLSFASPGSTMGEHSQVSGIERNVLSPRFNELRRAGFILYGDKRRCTTTGKTCLTIWPVTN